MSMRTSKLVPAFLNELEEQYNRFKIWTRYLGVFALGKGSAGHRPRHDGDTSDILISMLIRLSTKIRTLHEWAENRSTERSMQSAITTKDSGSSDSGSSLAFGSDCDSGIAQISEHGEQELRHPLLTDIEGIISRFYRFSTVIRKSSRRTDDLRVLMFIEEELPCLDLVELENHVRWQLQMRCPRLQADSALHQKLVNGVLHRRKRILYHSSHQRKLQHGLEDAFPSFDAYAEHPAENSTMSLELNEREQPTVPANKDPAKRAVTFIETTASTAEKVPSSAHKISVIFSGVTMPQTGRR